MVHCNVAVWQKYMGILGESGPSGSPNLDAISVQKMSFFTPAWSPGRFSLLSHPFSDLVSKKLCYHHLDQNANKIHFEFAYFSVYSYSYGIETINTFIYSDQ